MNPQSADIQIHGLYEPPPVPFRFETMGWYVLGGLLLLAALVFVIALVRKYLKNRYRRDALKELAGLENASRVFPRLSVVLKRAAMHAYGREQVAPLYGQEWLAFLDRTGKKVSLGAYREQILSAMYGGKELDPGSRQAVMSLAAKWIRTHAG